MLQMLSVVVSLGLGWFSYATTRRFVRDRLRYVDAAQRPVAPIVAGVAAAALASPVAWLLHLAGLTLTIGFGVALGVSAGAREVRRGLQLPPGA